MHTAFPPPLGVPKGRDHTAVSLTAPRCDTVPASTCFDYPRGGIRITETRLCARIWHLHLCFASRSWGEAVPFSPSFAAANKKLTITPAPMIYIMLYNINIWAQCSYLTVFGCGGGGTFFIAAFGAGSGLRHLQAHLVGTRCCGL